LELNNGQKDKSIIIKWTFYIMRLLLLYLTEMHW